MGSNEFGGAVDRPEQTPQELRLDQAELSPVEPQQPEITWRQEGDSYQYGYARIEGSPHRGEALLRAYSADDFKCVRGVVTISPPFTPGPGFLEAASPDMGKEVVYNASVPGYCTVFDVYAESTVLKFEKGEGEGEWRPASPEEDSGRYEAWSPEFSAHRIVAGFADAVKDLNAAVTHDTPDWYLFDDLRLPHAAEPPVVDMIQQPPQEMGQRAYPERHFQQNWNGPKI
jgi:hypothetical protein